MPIHETPQGTLAWGYLQVCRAYGTTECRCPICLGLCRIWGPAEISEVDLVIGKAKSIQGDTDENKSDG